MWSRFGLPAVRGIGSVVDGLRTQLGEHSGVEGIGRDRHQHLVAPVDQDAERKVDSLRCPGGQQDAFGRDGQAACGEVGRHRFTRLDYPGCRRVAVLAVPHRPLHRFNQVRRGLEPEQDRIADIEVFDVLTGRFDPARLCDNASDCVVESRTPLRHPDGERRLNRHTC